MGELALLVADVLGTRDRTLVLDLDANGQVVADGPAWSLRGRPPTSPELARLGALICARSTVAGVELSLTPLGRSVASVLRDGDAAAARA